MRYANRESDVLAGALSLLKLRGVFAWRCNSGVAFRDGRPIKLAPAGTADILGIVPGSGKLLAIECKARGGKLKENQRVFLANIRAAGGVALVVSDLAALDAALLELLRPAESAS
jgi:hypothetical protein